MIHFAFFTLQLVQRIAILVIANNLIAHVILESNNAFLGKVKIVCPWILVFNLFLNKVRLLLLDIILKLHELLLQVLLFAH